MTSEKSGSEHLVKTVLVAKGIAIILVVIGHYRPPGAPEYWATLRAGIYTFHMPLFFLLSGYLYHGLKKRSYRDHLKNKLHRLIIPFLSVALFFLAVKYLPNCYLKLENPITTASVINVFLDPWNSYIPMLWFVYTLLLIFMLYPALELCVKKPGHILLLSILIFLIPMPHLFCLDKLSENLPYFSLGVLLSYHVRLDRKQPLLASALILVASAMICYLPAHIATSCDSHRCLTLIKLATGMTGCLLCLLLSNKIQEYFPTSIALWLATVGVFSMSIYLFHTLFESSARVVFYQLMRADNHFEARALFAVASGVLMPMVLARYVLQRFYFTRKYLLGLGTQ
ncbi:MAG: acyltransferase family protein [Pseudomonadota bacterium]